MKFSTFGALTLASLVGLMVGICDSGPSKASAKSIPYKSISYKSVSYKLPNETATLKPGPNLEVVQTNCSGCHSFDYVQTQPRGPKFKEDFWRAEVTKMIKVYGAPIDEADVGKIVDYLAQTY
jgi:sulfite dehydrogenase (cytochrome) subunit B